MCQVLNSMSRLRDYEVLPRKLNFLGEAASSPTTFYTLEPVISSLPRGLLGFLFSYEVVSFPRSFECDQASTPDNVPRMLST